MAGKLQTQLFSLRRLPVAYISATAYDGMCIRVWLMVWMCVRATAYDGTLIRATAYCGMAVREIAYNKMYFVTYIEEAEGIRLTRVQEEAYSVVKEEISANLHSDTTLRPILDQCASIAG